MTTATIIIKDAKTAEGEDSIEIEGHLEPKNALDLPPTPAVIVGSYLAGNMDRVSKDAMAWFRALSMAGTPAADTPQVRAPKIITPDDINGHPV